MVKQVTTIQAIDRLKKLYRRKAGTWALQALGLQPPETVASSFPLHPPTQNAAMQNQREAIQWVTSWRALEPLADFVLWETRNWSLLGTQQVPVRVQITDPADVAAAIGQARHWTRLTHRFDALKLGLRDGTDTFLTSLAKNADGIAALAEVDFQRLFGVLAWLAKNPQSELYVRQLPIRGVDTKWIRDHNRLVTQLHTANTEHSDLGIRSEPEQWRIRLLDERLWLNGLSDITAPTDQLATLDLAAQNVLIVENLISLLTLPAMSQTVVVFGKGTAVTGLADLPWIHAATVYYWGDLDTHGFRILHSLRAAGIETASLLMDLPTLEAFEDLWVTESKPFQGELEFLTLEERAAFDYLREHRGTRLEQERIDWSYVLDTLAVRGLLSDRLD